jgi:hypothetical protein
MIATWCILRQIRRPLDGEVPRLERGICQFHDERFPNPKVLDLPDEPQPQTPLLMYRNMKNLPSSESPPDSCVTVNDGTSLCDIAKKASVISLFAITKFHA